MAVDELAAFVIEHLPDSSRLQQSLLEDLLVVIGEEHPLHGAVAGRLHALERAEANQLNLALQFRQRATGGKL